MGKKRIAVVSQPAGKKKKNPAKEKRAVVKTGKEHGRITDMGTEALVEAEAIKEKTQKLAKEVSAKKKKRSLSTKARKGRSKRYLAARKQIDQHKTYPLSKAIKLLKKISIARFNASVEVHLSTRQAGLQTEVEFPHSIGKTAKIAIADDQILAKIEKGKIDFDVLLATPAMMPKLVKYAKILGPKGLLPNPKSGTITNKPADLAKSMTGKIQIKTEAKMPLIHQVIGKVNDPEKKLFENFQALIKAIGPNNIRKATLTSTMGPGIKLALDKI